MLSLPLRWLTVVTSKKTCVAACKREPQSTVCTDKKHYCVTGDCQEGITTRRKGLWQCKQALCWLQLSTNRSKFLLCVITTLHSFQTATLFYNLLDSNSIQPFAHGFKASICCYTNFFARHHVACRPSALLSKPRLFVDCQCCYQSQRCPLIVNAVVKAKVVCRLSKLLSKPLQGCLSIVNAVIKAKVVCWSSTLLLKPRVVCRSSMLLLKPCCHRSEGVRDLARERKDCVMRTHTAEHFPVMFCLPSASLVVRAWANRYWQCIMNGLLLV